MEGSKLANGIQPSSGQGRDEPKQKNSHCPSSGADGNHPEHAAACHLEQGARQAWLALAQGCGWRGAAVRRAAPPASRGARKGLRRAVLRPPIGIRRGRTLWATGRIYRPGRRVPNAPPERQRQGCLRDRAEARRWFVSTSLYGDPGRRNSMGGGMHLAGRPQWPPGLFPRRLAQLRGNRPHVDRRRRHGKSVVFHCNDRLLPRRAAGRLHQGFAGASAQR